MKMSLLFLGFAIAGAGTLAAAPATDSMSAMDMSGNTGTALVQPQWLLNGDGLIGVRSEPTQESGHGIASLGAGVEYIPDFLPELGWNVDYNYLAESKPTSTGRDSDIDLALNFYYYNFTTVGLWAKAGIGFNTTPNGINGRYLAFVEPGVRWNILPRLALDGGIQYMSQTPKSGFVQSFGVNLGLSVPLDAVFGNSQVAMGSK